MRVTTFSRNFPVKHPKAGNPTFFVEQIYNAIGLKIGVTKRTGDIPEAMWNLVNDFVLLDGDMKKYHTIRAGNRWKVGDWFSPRIWGDDINPKSGKSGPYQSKQIEFAPAIQIKKIWTFESIGELFFLNGKQFDVTSSDLPVNDGLSTDEFLAWFDCHTKKNEENNFHGQVLCWNENIEY